MSIVSLIEFVCVSRMYDNIFFNNQRHSFKLDIGKREWDDLRTSYIMFILIRLRDVYPIFNFLRWDSSRLHVVCSGLSRYSATLLLHHVLSHCWSLPNNHEYLSKYRDETEIHLIRLRPPRVPSRRVHLATRLGRSPAWISPMQLIRSEVIGDTWRRRVDDAQSRGASAPVHRGDALTTRAHSRTGRRNGRTYAVSCTTAFPCTDAVRRRSYISSVRCRKSTAVPFKFRWECNRPVRNSKCTWTFSWVSAWEASVYAWAVQKFLDSRLLMIIYTILFAYRALPSSFTIDNVYDLFPNNLDKLLFNIW